ncbi:MAG: hypothetical protein JXA73_25170 [Acidobacteria bacterium]|nr:hypothetical protein [Acidobacteriota bacterium]
MLPPVRPPQLQEIREHEAIDGAFQDDDLVSQGKDLGLEREARSKAGEKG